MKRDWDAMRLVLMRVEELPDMQSQLFAHGLPELPVEVANYHLWLCVSSGLVIGPSSHVPFGSLPTVYYASSLTYEGHELLDLIRSNTAWNRIRSWLAERSIDLSTEAIKAAATSILRSL